MGKTHPPSLRTILTVVPVVGMLLALLVSAAFVFLGTTLRHTTHEIGASLESVRLGEDAEINLLLYGRAQDRLVRRNLEVNVRQLLGQARPFVTTDEETRLLDDARREVEHYFLLTRDPERSPGELEAQRDAAFVAMKTFVNATIVESEAEQARAARWSQRGNTFAVATTAIVLVFSAALLAWLRGGAFRPVLSLAATMQRFGEGDQDARAEEHGPAELRAMSRQFNEMAAALAAQREAQMAFLAGVAHDLRNPLAALKLSLGMIRPGQPLPPEPRVRRAVEIVNGQVTRLERMLGDFLNRARIEAGELELRLQPEDARRIVCDVVDVYEGASPLHRIETSLPAEVVPLHCDPLRIGQVVMNLISNAIKYTPAGGTVEVRLEVHEREVAFLVTDHGIGISPEDQRRLFEPFQRVGGFHAEVPGVGLGLFVVRRIVEAHRGRIEIESTIGRGSTFRVYLPLSPELAPEIAPLTAEHRQRVP